MAADLVIACPTCSQKYHVSANRVGQHAHCKKCGQRFRIETEEPIDDDTIMGWVMEEESTAESVMGGTSIFESPRTSEPESSSVTDWPPNSPPATPRVRLKRIDPNGACFEFPSRELGSPDVRTSFPLKCIHCHKDDNLNVNLIIWNDKLPQRNAIHRKNIKTGALGRLDQMFHAHRMQWFDELEPIANLPSPYCNPFPYFVCGNCGALGKITATVRTRDGEKVCRIGIPNLDVAREFFFNNGGENAKEYQQLVDAGIRQRDDRWQRLSIPVRSRISSWFKLDQGERFLGYFSDTDFSRAETGSAGVVLTDRRLVFKKYSTHREFDVDAGGRLIIEADKRNAIVRIRQDDANDATLRSNPTAASHLARALASLKQPWQVKVETKNIGPE